MDTEFNEPLIGANLIIVGTTIGASTDIDGNYSLTSNQPLPWTLEVSYTGFCAANNYRQVVLIQALNVRIWNLVR